MKIAIIPTAILVMATATACNRGPAISEKRPSPFFQAKASVRGIPDPVGKAVNDALLAARDLANRGEVDKAVALLKPIISSPVQGHSVFAAFETGCILFEAGRNKEALAAFQALLTGPYGRNFSAEGDGQIHARIAAIAVRTNDDGLLQETIADFAHRTAASTASLAKYLASHHRGVPAPNPEPAWATPMVELARILRYEDPAACSALYERAIAMHPSTRLTYEYGNLLVSEDRAQLALRVLSNIPQPAPKEIQLPLAETMRRLRFSLAQGPKVTEAEELQQSIKKMTELRHRYKMQPIQEVRP